MDVQLTTTRHQSNGNIVRFDRIFVIRHRQEMRLRSQSQSGNRQKNPKRVHQLHMLNGHPINRPLSISSSENWIKAFKTVIHQLNKNKLLHLPTCSQTFLSIVKFEERKFNTKSKLPIDCMGTYMMDLQLSSNYFRYWKKIQNTNFFMWMAIQDMTGIFI